MAGKKLDCPHGFKMRIRGQCPTICQKKEGKGAVLALAAHPVDGVAIRLHSDFGVPDVKA